MSEEIDLRSRLIIPGDFRMKEPGDKGIDNLFDSVEDFMAKLEGTGVVVKFNSLLRFGSYYLIEEAHSRGLSVFADLKLHDIPNTMETDAEILAHFKPEFLTVMCAAGTKGMTAVQRAVGKETKVLGVTVLTSHDQHDSNMIFGCGVNEGVKKFAAMARDSGLDGLILSPKKIELIKQDSTLSNLSLNTPGIRPLWHLGNDDDQSRVMTPYDAIKAGAERIVVGRPILQAKNMKEAIDKTLAEIEDGLAAR